MRSSLSAQRACAALAPSIHFGDVRFARSLLAAMLACAALAQLAAGPAGAGGEGGSRRAASPRIAAAGLWAPPKEGGPLTLAAFDRPDPVRAALADDTRIEGSCVHCNIALQCRAADLAKQCGVCPCGLTNIACFSGKAPAEKTWRALMEALPEGTRVRVEYESGADGKPGEKVKRIVIDRRGAVLPVEGLPQVTPQQLQDLGKAVGATRAELNPAGDRLQLSLRTAWTAGMEGRLEKALAALGAKVSPTPAAPRAGG